MAAKTVLNYLPRESVVHKLTGTTKLAFFLLFTFASMITYNTWVLLALLAVSLAAFKLSRIRFREVRFMLVFMLVFLLLNNLFKRFCPGLEHQFRFLFISVLSRIGLATVIARICSGVVNYLLNQKMVFHYHGSGSRSFLRYLCVFILNMLLSAGLTSTLHLWLGWSDNISKIPVDLLLFFLSYYLQRKWVFRQQQG